LEAYESDQKAATDFFSAALIGGHDIGGHAPTEAIALLYQRTD
jgi:hypothetical protein